MHDKNDLINRLLTIAGMIMEDEAAVALIDDPTKSCEQRISSIQAGALDIAAIAAAAKVIARRYHD